MNRRDFIGAGITAGMTGVSSDTAMAKPSTGYNLAEPVDLLHCHVKLRGSLDERMVIWWLKATQYAVVDTVLTPLYRLHNASFQKFGRLADDHFGITMLELAYFTDVDTGEVLRDWRNPFTGKTGQVPPELFGPNRVSLNTDGLQPPEFFPFGTLSFEGRLGPGYTDGEDIWVREDTIVRMESKDPAYGNYIYNELVTYSGRMADVNNPAMASAAARITYSTTSNWRPWMQPGDTPGHIMAEGFGKKVRSVDALPATYLAMAREHHPEVLADPERWLTQPPPAPPGD